jgi:Flp pilus assembly protein TadG
MVEFALVLPLFLMAVFICIRSAIWAEQEMVAVANVSHYATLLVSIPTSSMSSYQIGQEDAVVLSQAQKQIQNGMFGTKVSYQIPQSGNCPTVRSLSTGRAVICVINNLTVNGDPGYVEIVVVAKPSLFGPNWSFAAPIYVETAVKSEGFAS